MGFREAARDHYTSLQSFYERLTRNSAIHLPLWLPGTATAEEALMNALLYMANFCEPSRGQQILDAGCGLGGTAFWLAEKFGVRVLGVSNSAPNIDRCRELAKDKEFGHLIEFQVNDLMTAVFSENTFDSVWNLESINYLCPKRTYIDRTFRILRPGGRWLCMDRYCDPLGCGDGVNKARLATLTTGFYTPQHWEGVNALQEYMSQAGFVDIQYSDLTQFVFRPGTKRRVTGPTALRALLPMLWRPSSFRALLRAHQVIQASFALMERGLMTYGLLSGTKPVR